jgi:DNA-binding response OmpR family regulator
MSTQKKILLTEDDVNLGAILAERLRFKGFEVTLCTDGIEAYEQFAKNNFDLIILDIMMPLKDGFTLAKDIRSIDDKIPIIFVTARSMKEDVLKGFDIGGDDYITKPFSMEELLMRINAVLKRTASKTVNLENAEFTIGQYKFNHLLQILSFNDEEYKLTSKESDLMKILCQNVNEVVMRDSALKQIWGDDTYFNGRSMDVFISKLRKLISQDPNLEIMNVHGKGFKLLVKNAVN